MTKKTKNIFAIFPIVFLIIIIFEGNKFAKSENSRIKIYINNSKELKSEKNKIKISSSKSDGKKINYFVKNLSKAQSRKSKKKIALDGMKESGLATKNIVKENRWFVKKPFQKSYNKISKIKRVTPLKFETADDKNISIKASKISKTRARETGYIKPEEIYSKDSSRKAKFISTSQTISSGPVKSGPVYSEDSSRLASDISKTRSRETSPINPKIIYSDQIGREAFKMSLMKKNNFKNFKNSEPAYSDQRYTVKFLRSLSRITSVKKEYLNEESNNLKK